MINIIYVAVYKIWKKYNEIQLTKKMDLNNQKLKIIHRPPNSYFKNLYLNHPNLFAKRPQLKYNIIYMWN